MHKLLLSLACLFFTYGSSAQKALTRTYTPAQCSTVIHKATRLLSRYQPGVYRYHSKASFDQYADSLLGTIKTPLSELALYRKLKPLVSRIGCLHTDLTSAVHYKHSLRNSPSLIPLQLYFEGNRAFVIKNYSADKTIIPGDEITHINGQSIPALLQILLPAIPSDGYNLTMKYLALYHQFPSWYRSFVAVDTSFTLTAIRRSQSFTSKLAGVLEKDLVSDGFLRPFRYPQQLAFQITDQTGYLTIHTFAQSDIKKGGQDFHRFLQQAFDSLQAQNIRDLVIDLRYNTGGSDTHAAYFSRYFFTQPYRYWDRIEVTPQLAKKIKGLARIWYRSPVLQDSTWRWQKAKTVHDFDFYEWQSPAAHPYAGKVYVLINGFCMSSCADLTAILSHHKKAVFIGEETGGGYQGNNSGIMPGENLRPSGLVLTLPLQQYFNAVDPTINIGRGTLPDYPAPMTVAALLNGQDPAMETARSLIQASRTKASH
ncbi:S41 family peptidase [Chitinophaga nivalis]|uniref:S41 family peptidase n=1 Tax=Chitinophaga nivalis TaxID=2991709 RepID=A0ABT3IP68_9BACT|nr:S41 family peptidase [Chitinophaga nivalis]MCW3464538.1 S41 family peptidase [Chitinophaga nivalis]MCW3485771.1 S41 family peptidase [Chitinophaga nivalis]